MVPNPLIITRKTSLDDMLPKYQKELNRFNTQAIFTKKIIDELLGYLCSNKSISCGKSFGFKDIHMAQARVAYFLKYPTKKNPIKTRKRKAKKRLVVLFTLPASLLSFFTRRKNGK